MTKLMVRLQNNISDREERGAAMAEYGLLLALVALAAILVLSAFGDSISAVFSGADSQLKSGLAKAGNGGGGDAGDAPAGDAPAGDAPAGDAPAGDAPAG